MPTLKLAPATHRQLQALAQQHLQPMKRLVGQLVALLDHHQCSPQALAQLVATAQAQQRLEAPFNKALQQLLQRLKTQESTLLLPSLQKLTVLAELVEGQAQEANNQLATASLQNTLERLEALAQDQAAALQALLHDPMTS